MSNQVFFEYPRDAFKRDFLMPRRFTEMERRFDVNAVTFRGLRLWPLLRQMLLQVLRTSGGGHYLRPLDRIEEPTQTLAARTRERLERLAPGTDILVMSRAGDYSITPEGRLYDAYCDPLVEIARRGFTCLKFGHEWETNPDNSRKIYPDEFHLGVDTTMRILEDASELEGFEAFNQATAEVLGVQLEHSAVARAALEILGLSGMYRDMLALIRPRALFMTCFYSLPSYALIHACRMEGVVSVDMQHGSQENNPAYSPYTAPPRAGYDMLPDVFWTWNEHCAQALEEANRFGDTVRHHPVVAGHFFLDRWREAAGPGLAGNLEALLERRARYVRAVLVTLNNAETLVPPNLLEAMSMAPPDWLWLVRQHPRQASRRGELERLFAASGVAHVELDFANSLPLPALLEVCEHHLSLCSASVYEALHQGVGTTFVHPEGYVFHRALVRAGLAGYALCPGRILRLAARDVGGKTSGFFPDSAIMTPRAIDRVLAMAG